ncbi:putative nuclease HARBI1 [Eurosta solidaginis]|uniref:putative nuclease HARBI1 n=1 Tax=Eurosta solidaginis TaxID=178769 RepID=UPI00353067FD
MAVLILISLCKYSNPAIVDICNFSELFYFICILGGKIVKNLMDLRDSGESDCDFEALQVIVLRRKRKIKERPDFFLYYDDVDFRERFRMCKDAAWFVFSLIKDKIYLGARNNAMQPHQMFFIALRFYASGSFQQIVADLSGVLKASASRAITLVSYHLASLRPDFVLFPQTEQERLETQAAFKEKANFPRVIGAMDCSHIKINSPGEEDQTYVQWMWLQNGTLKRC